MTVDEGDAVQLVHSPEELLVTWPTQLATALGESTAPAAAHALWSSLPDLFGGLVSF